MTEALALQGMVRGNRHLNILLLRGTNVQIAARETWHCGEGNPIRKSSMLSGGRGSVPLV